MLAGSHICNGIGVGDRVESDPSRYSVEDDLSHSGRTFFFLFVLVWGPRIAIPMFFKVGLSETKDVEMLERAVVMQARTWVTSSGFLWIRLRHPTEPACLASSSSSSGSHTRCDRRVSSGISKSRKTPLSQSVSQSASQSKSNT